MKPSWLQVGHYGGQDHYISIIFPYCLSIKADKIVFQQLIIPLFDRQKMSWGKLMIFGSNELTNEHLT